jgi:hypothetical protein
VVFGKRDEAVDATGVADHHGAAPARELLEQVHVVCLLLALIEVAWDPTQTSRENTRARDIVVGR